MFQIRFSNLKTAILSLEKEIMKKRLIALLLITLFIGSCAPVSVLPPSPTLDTVTLTILPSQTPRPTQTAIPTATPYPLLHTNGPYLLFTYNSQNSFLKNFTIIDADGSGRRQFQLPNDGYVSVLHYAISPDKKWLVYFTGSAEEPYDLALNLLNLSDSKSQLISNLIAPNFPENLEPIVETMVLGDPPNYYTDCFEDIDCRRSLVKREFVGSIYSFDWAPNSQSIAFTAQIDGPSSDIYIYSLADKTLQRLTNEIQNIYWMDWAPSGKRILYEICSTPGAGYEGRTLHITDLEGKTTFIDEENLYNQRWGELDWLTENMYLLYHPNDTDPPIYDLRILNTDTGQLKEIWPYSADSLAVNRENDTIVLLFRNHHNQSFDIPEGIYMVYSSGKYWKISDAGIIFVLSEGEKPYSIFAQDYNKQFYSVSSNGVIDSLPWANERVPWISPDEKLLLFREEGKLALYTDSYQPIKSWQIDDSIYSVTWRPDSLGLFIFTEINMYYLAVPDGELNPLLDNCSPNRCEVPRFVWLP